MPKRVRSDREVHRLPTAMRRGCAKPFTPGYPQTIPSSPSSDLPLERTVGRRISFRSKGSARCASSVTVPTADGIVLDRSESILERHAKAILLSRADCHELRSQVGPVAYEDFNGKARNHFLDIVFIDQAGLRTAFLVKPQGAAEGEIFQRDARRIAVATVPRYADDAKVLTDAHFTRSDTVNACTYLHFSRFPDPAADAAVEDAARHLQGIVCLDTLVRMTPFGGRAFRAAFKAIFRGLLKRKTGGVIDRWTLVEWRVVQ